MIESFAPGLGTMIRRLLAELDGGTQQIYDQIGASFRPRYFPIAQHLMKHNATAVSRLSQELSMTQPAISQTLKEMERDRLVMFESGGDRRIRLARLTDHGRSTCRELERVWAASAQSADELGREIGVDLPDLLGRLIAALETRPFAIRIEEKLA